MMKYEIVKDNKLHQQLLFMARRFQGPTRYHRQANCRYKYILMMLLHYIIFGPGNDLLECSKDQEKVVAEFQVGSGITPEAVALPRT